MNPMKQWCGKWCDRTVLQKHEAKALLLLRFIAGFAFMLHGWGKIQTPMSWMGPESPVPGIFQLLAAVSEFGGGLGWVLGLLTCLSSFGIACTMGVAIYMHAIVWGQPFVGKGGSYELALLYLAVAVLLAVTGPGKYSIDEKWCRKKSST